MVTTWQQDANFGRVLAAYGGFFGAGSIAWGVVADAYRPDPFDIVGTPVRLAATAALEFSRRPGVRPR
ncbi:hypothetical protein [Streptomyces sp. NBC_00019]|uniref:hypothetical protein n=1 Tax=Streptomyces sp. NBC_00019 TaxID=2975623 RepID=UPI00386ECF2C